MLIKNFEVVENPWTLIARDSELDAALAAGGSHLLVPMVLWLDSRDALLGSGKSIGVWIDSDENPEELDGLFDGLSLIALNFPAFTDGRGFSSAFVLRRHLNYAGELRAIGDVQRDQLFYMKRCGIDSYDMAENVKEQDAISAFNDFATSYQATVEEPRPLFRRR